MSNEAILKTTLFGPEAKTQSIIAYEKDQPLGFAIFFYDCSTFKGRNGIYIEDLFVKPSARSKGVGQKLLTYLARLAKEKQCCRLQWFVQDWNEKAIRFYDRIGAKHIDGWKLYRVSDNALDQLANDSLGDRTSNR